MGTVYRQDGRRNWMIKYYRDGCAIVESARSPDRTEAKKLLRQREADIDRGLPLGPKVGRIRFDEASADILTDYRVTVAARCRSSSVASDYTCNPSSAGAAWLPSQPRTFARSPDGAKRPAPRTLRSTESWRC